MNNIKFFYGVCVLLWCVPTQATDISYVVNNYEGSIGKYPIHLSLQYYEFGKSVTVEGSYYYDSHRSPIPLYGMHTSNSVVLCEASGEDDFEKFIVQGEKFDSTKCPFKLIKKNTDLAGQWRYGQSNLAVDLKETIGLGEGILHGNMKALDIPFWGQTKNHIFIGVYEKSSYGVAINKVNVVEKKSGKTIQVIDPQLHNCEFGSYMTSIFQNIEKNDSEIRLNCYSTGPDVSVIYRFNKQTSLYNVVGE